MFSKGLARSGAKGFACRWLRERDLLRLCRDRVLYLSCGVYRCGLRLRRRDLRLDRGRDGSLLLSSYSIPALDLVVRRSYGRWYREGCLGRDLLGRRRREIVLLLLWRPLMLRRGRVPLSPGREASLSLLLLDTAPVLSIVCSGAVWMVLAGLLSLDSASPFGFSLLRDFDLLLFFFL